MKRLLETLGAGVAVYLLVAACSGGGSLPSASQTNRMDASAPAAGGKVAQAGAQSAGQSDAQAVGGGGSGSIVDSTMDAAASFVDAMTSPVPEAVAYESGARVRAKWLVGDDGARQFVGWHDSIRDEDCTYQETTADYRCLPNSVGTDTLAAYGPDYFSDAACQKPLLHYYAGLCASTGYAVSRAAPPNTCQVGKVSGAYAVAGLFTDTVFYSRAAGGPCQLATVALNPAASVLYDLVAVPLTVFAAAAVQVE